MVDQFHIPIASLWEYSRNPHPAAFPPAEFDHLRTCERCVSVLWICHTSDSIDHMNQRLKDQGLEIF
jgi:hypothetical protein